MWLGGLLLLEWTLNPTSSTQQTNRGRTSIPKPIIASGLVAGFLIISRLRSPCALRTTPYVVAGGSARILARQQSVTGLILAVDDLKRGHRYLRCDHSRLGGYFAYHTDHPITLGEPLYSMFVLQDVVRLVNIPAVKEPKKALVMLDW
jgi:hypothetical protein